MQRDASERICTAETVDGVRRVLIEQDKDMPRSKREKNLEEYSIEAGLTLVM